MRPIPTTLAEAVRLYLELGEGQDGAFSVLLDEFLDAFYTETEPTQRADAGWLRCTAPDVAKT